MAATGAFDPYPAFVDLTSRLIVVVGDGQQAERKARSLLRHGPDIAVITPDPPLSLIESQGEGLLTIEQREFEPGDLAGAFAVFCVSGSEEVREAVVADARAHGCLVNVSGAPGLSNFSVPSVVRRGPLQIAISTSGAAPVLAKRLRQHLKDEYGEEWGAYVALFGELRALLSERMPGRDADQRAVLEAVADSDLLERIRNGSAPDAEALFGEFAPTDAEAAASESDAGTEPATDDEADTGSGKS